MGFQGKIAIGVPHKGPLEGYFVDTLLHLSKPDNTVMFRVADMAVDLARNLVVESALKDPDVTHVFFMDSDMQFHTDSLIRLVQRDKPVVGGIYFSRTETPVPHAYAFHHEDPEGEDCPLGFDHSEHQRGRWYRPLHKEFAAFVKRHPEYATEPMCAVLPQTPDTLVEADAMATGCLLIKRDVLEAVGYPWFRNHEHSAGGEDFFFCERARALGFPIYADFSVQCTHEYRYLFIARDNFVKCFGVGGPDEHDFERPLIVDAGPRPKLAVS